MNVAGATENRMATPEENKARLDNHSLRIRSAETRLGRNGLVSETLCRARHEGQEMRMDKIEKRTAGIDTRLWALLAIALATLLGVVLGR
jgi:hypothetical protein